MQEQPSLQDSSSKRFPSRKRGDRLWLLRFRLYICSEIKKEGCQDKNARQHPCWRSFSSHTSIIIIWSPSLLSHQQSNQKTRRTTEMALPSHLNFITGNANKLKEAKAILGDTIELRTQALDLVEIQGTIEEVSADKCRRAAELVCVLSCLYTFKCIYGENLN